eukprot:scaffold102515_cov63-Attheya_sp.AAC.10
MAPFTRFAREQYELCRHVRHYYLLAEGLTSFISLHKQWNSIGNPNHHSFALGREGRGFMIYLVIGNARAHITDVMREVWER